MKLFGEKQWDIDRIWRFILGAIVIFVLYAVLSTLRGVLLPFGIAFVLAYLLSPVVDFLTRHRWNRTIAVLATLLVLFGLITVVLWLTIPRFVNELAGISTQLADYIRQSYDFIFEQISGTDSAGENEILNAIVDQLKSSDISDYIQSAVFGIFSGIISIGYYLISFAIIPIAAFFFLSDFQRIRDRWRLHIPKQIREKAIPFVVEVNGIMSAFFRGQFVIVIILSILFSIGFSIVGVPIAIILGITIGFLNLIPYFGTLVGIVPLVLLTLGKSLQLGENPLNRLVGVAIVMVVVQAIQDWVLTPKIMRNRVGLRPITILMSAVIWGTLLGFTGLLIAIPLSAIGKVYFHRYFLVEEEIKETGQENRTATSEKNSADG
jgi:predicted PurR-regulated permease PerM